MVVVVIVLVVEEVVVVVIVLVVVLVEVLVNWLQPVKAYSIHKAQQRMIPILNCNLLNMVINPPYSLFISRISAINLG